MAFADSDADPPTLTVQGWGVPGFHVEQPLLQHRVLTPDILHVALAPRPHPPAPTDSQTALFASQTTFGSASCPDGAGEDASLQTSQHPRSRSLENCELPGKWNHGVFRSSPFGGGARRQEESKLEVQVLRSCVPQSWHCAFAANDFFPYPSTPAGPERCPWKSRKPVQSSPRRKWT
eukprot:1917761-Rhodomonas_salina.1